MCTEEVSKALVRVIENDHKIIAANTVAMGSLAETLRSMQTTMELLVGQVTATISQRNDGVPIKIFLIVVGVMALIVIGVLGLSLKDLAIFAGG